VFGFLSIMPLHKWDFGENKDAEIAFKKWLSDDSELSCFSFAGPNADIIGLFDDGDWSWTKVPKLLDNKLRGRQKTLPRPTYVATGLDQYYIQFADGKCEWVGPRLFSKAINNSTSAVSKVAFYQHKGWYVLFKDGSSEWDGLPKTLHSLLKRKKKLLPGVRDISISPEGNWFVVFNDGDWRAQLPQKCRRTIDAILHECSSKVIHVWLGHRGTFCVLYDYYGTPAAFSPWDISFSNETISAHFNKGMSIWKAISDMEKAKLFPDSFPSIRVFRDRERLVSLDNRRLFVFQNASVKTISAIIIESPCKTIQSFHSVTVKSCVCRECSYGSDIIDKNGAFKNKSWAWLHFVKSTTPSSALLLSHNQFPVSKLNQFAFVNPEYK